MSHSRKGLVLTVACVLGVGVAGAADAAVSGGGWERAALQWQAQGQFDSAANGFQKAAEAFAAEGNADAKIRALQEAATANERYADQLLAGAPVPAQARRQAIATASTRSGELPPGRYACSFANGGSPGYVDIRGGSYRGPDLEPSGGFSAYALSGTAITWTAGFGAFAVVNSQSRGVDTGGRPWFTITYRRTRGGGVDAVDCVRE